MKNFTVLNECIDIQVLQEIQDKFSEATGFAVVTVDYMGRPITKYSGFSSFCMLFRKNEKCNDACLRSDAHGGIEAARSGKPYIYKCHAGLIDFAIPIIVKGQYLGAILAGQVKVKEDKQMHLVPIGNQSWEWKKDTKLLEAYESIRFVSYDKIIAAADMMFVISNYFIEKGMVQFIKEELNKKNLQLIEEMKLRADLEKSLKISEIKALESQLDPQFLFNVLNTIARLALIENAPNTQEIVFSFAELLRYATKKNPKHFVKLKDEIHYIQNYLKIQSIRLGDGFKYTIHVQEEVHDCNIPFMLLKPIVENAVHHGIEKKKKGGTIKLSIWKLDEKMIIEVKDSGVGMCKEKIYHILKDHKDQSEIKKDIYHLKQTLQYLFKEDHKLDIYSRLNQGTTVRIQIPVHNKDEGGDYV